MNFKDALKALGLHGRNQAKQAVVQLYQQRKIGALSSKQLEIMDALVDEVGIDLSGDFSSAVYQNGDYADGYEG